MPELPEVETIAQDLRNSKLIGRKITGMRLFWTKTLASPSQEEFLKKVVGKKLTAIERRGKYLVLVLNSNDYIFIHLRMSGRLSIQPKDTAVKPHDRLCLEFDHKDELRFHDTRKFGRWHLTSHSEEITGELGPEPLDEGFTVEELARMIKKKSRQIKPLLLDQSFIAGMGNIYVDEALWEAKIHPQTLSNQLSKKNTHDLLIAIKHVLLKGIETSGTSLGTGKVNYFRVNGESGKHQHSLNVYGKTGKPCPRCGSPLKRIIVAQRSTHFCPKCQTSKH